MEDSKENVNDFEENMNCTSESTTSSFNTTPLETPIDYDDPTNHPLFNTIVDICAANMQLTKSTKDLDLKRANFCLTSKQQDQFIPKIRRRLDDTKQYSHNLNQRIEGDLINQERINCNRNDFFKFAKDIDVMLLELLEPTFEIDNTVSQLIMENGNGKPDKIIQSGPNIELEEKIEYIKNRKLEMEEQNSTILQYENEIKTKDNDFGQENVKCNKMIEHLENSIFWENIKQCENQNKLLEKKNDNKQKHSDLLNKWNEQEEYNKNLMDRFKNYTKTKEQLLLDVNGTRKELLNSEKEINTLYESINRVNKEKEIIQAESDQRPESQNIVPLHMTKIPYPMFLNRNFRPRYRLKNSMTYEKVSSSVPTILAGASTAANTITSLSVYTEEIVSSTDMDNEND